MSEAHEAARTAAGAQLPPWAAGVAVVMAMLGGGAGMVATTGEVRELRAVVTTRLDSIGEKLDDQAPRLAKLEAAWIDALRERDDLRRRVELLESPRRP